MLGGGGRGLRRAAHRSRRPAVALCRGGATPAAGRRLGWAWELRWGEVKPFPRSIGAGEGRRWELSGEAVGGGNHGSQRLFWAGLRSGGNGLGASARRSEGRGGIKSGRGRVERVLRGAQAGPATMAGGDTAPEQGRARALVLARGEEEANSELAS